MTVEKSPTSLLAVGDTLVGIDQLCAKLSVSRSTLERLRKPAPGDGSDEFAGAPPFPEPTLLIGRSPRWRTSVVDSWLDLCAARVRTVQEVVDERRALEIQNFANRHRVPI
jgi:predicted DNA-binding transcriptional regulator AlpA